MNAARPHRGGAHPICATCAGLPPSGEGMPAFSSESTRLVEEVAVGTHVFPGWRPPPRHPEMAAPFPSGLRYGTVLSRQGAAAETCCFCGDVTDQGYATSEHQPRGGCAETLPIEGQLRKARQRARRERARIELEDAAHDEEDE